MAKLKLVCFTLFTSCVMSRAVWAGQILSPVAVLQNTASDYSAAAAIDSTIDQSGLSVPFVSGTTDFATYIGSNPRHEWIFTDGSEWFSTSGVTTGTIVYDLGASYSIAQLALWNEEFSGIQTMRVETAIDALFAGAVVVGSFNPTDTPFDQSYLAEVFGLTASVGRYVRLSITGPQSPNRGTYLSMGEIAFDVGPANAVPEPATLSLLAGGVSLLALKRRFSR